MFCEARLLLYNAQLGWSLWNLIFEVLLFFYIFSRNQRQNLCCLSFYCFFLGNRTGELQLFTFCYIDEWAMTNSLVTVDQLKVNKFI